MFFPGVIGVFINPFFLARRNLWKGIENSSHYLGGKLLDVGCGSKPYQNLFQVSEYIGLDIDSDLARQRDVADYFYDGTIFPFEDASFDSVLCNQVLEHVFNPDAFLEEIARVLKNQGTLLLTIPFVWDEHEQPWDYARYSSFGLAHLLHKHGFEIQFQKKLAADLSVVFQLLNAYLFKVTKNWPQLFSLAFTFIIMAPISILGLVLGKILPSNSDLYLDNLVVATKLVEESE